jgi:cardiolipin synthase
VRIESMLEVGVIRTLFARIDLRNHRKIAVIDGEVGYTGSANIADPQLFKADEGVGQWYDAMVRVTGPAVEALQVTLLGDWDIETEEGIANARDMFDVKRCSPTGSAIAQVLPSGPGLSALSIQELLLAAIFGAEQEVLLTTPYFIPDDALIKALLAAAARGVDVTLVVPRYSDSKVVRLAGEAYFEELMESGVKIKRFTAGMLHTKAISIDGEVAIFGSVNLDMRSFYLNFEISLIAYDVEFAQAVRRLQRQYAARSDEINVEAWQARPLLLRFVQHSCQLLSPLL